ncbi:MAG: CDP-alcohol phosphatidyltransferase family protein [Streptosporangiales bacterium]|nr:CDP-alcohol phosphatidyltransferase family protein [Streptosporangiales bacterium]
MDGEPPLRVLTWPNLLSGLRLLGVPLFLWLVLGPESDGWAVVVLAVSSVTDYLDGWLARVLNQTSRLGQMLDPVADRLYIFAIGIGLMLRDVVPWWLVAVLALREVVVAVWMPALYRHGYGPLQVHILGKAGTLCVLYAFPVLYLGVAVPVVEIYANVIGWAFALWGIALYWVAGVLYVEQARRLIRDQRQGRGPGRPELDRSEAGA